MATAVLDYNMFAGPYHHRVLALHPTVDCSPVSKAVTGGPVYYRQPEVIQLVEVAAPPSAEQHSTITSASMPSSSSYSESCDSSETDSEEDEDCISYCSSDPEEMEESSYGYYDDTYSTRLKRVLAWRDGFAKAMGAAISSDALSSPYHSILKRKIDTGVVEHETASISSKRCRAGSQAEPSMNPLPRRRLSQHSCSACDSDFATRQSLRDHARESRRDACRASVEYSFE